MTQQQQDEFAMHLGLYARHERLYDEPFSAWAIKFIEKLIQEEHDRWANQTANDHDAKIRSVILERFDKDMQYMFANAPETYHEIKAKIYRA